MTRHQALEPLVTARAVVGATCGFNIVDRVASVALVFDQERAAGCDRSTPLGGIPLNMVTFQDLLHRRTLNRRRFGFGLVPTTCDED